MESVLEFAYSELKKYYRAVMDEECAEIELAVDPSMADFDEDAYLDDKFSISVREGKGAITGMNARSVLIGVYRLFRELGCVFVRPGKNGEKLVKRAKKQCTVELFCKPHYRFRTITIEGSNSIEDILDLIDWSMKNGFNSYFTQFRDSHTFFERWYKHERNEFAVGENLTTERTAEFMRQIVAALKQRGMLYHAVGHGWTCECLSFP